MRPAPERRDDLERALAAVREAGDRVMRTFRTDAEVRHKSPDQPVTEADLAADAILAERLLEGRPADGWLSEETVDDRTRLERRRVWVVDPIDGTRSFVAGYREFAISVGLVEDGAVVVGVVYNPAVDDVYWAVRGHGAWRARHWTGGTEGADRLAVRAPAEGRRPGMLASRSEAGTGEMAPFEAEWTIHRLGSTAYKLAALAAGVGDAFVSRGPKSEWDLAGGALVVEEAGGVVTDVLGAPLRFNRHDPYVHGVVAAVPELHAALVERARSLPSPRLESGAGRKEG